MVFPVPGCAAIPQAALGKDLCCRWRGLRSRDTCLSRRWR
jgi:hypothetical protein